MPAFTKNQQLPPSHQILWDVQIKAAIAINSKGGSVFWNLESIGRNESSMLLITLPTEIQNPVGAGFIIVYFHCSSFAVVEGCHDFSIISEGCHSIKRIKPSITRRMSEHPPNTNKNLYIKVSLSYIE